MKTTARIESSLYWSDEEIERVVNEWLAKRDAEGPNHPGAKLDYMFSTHDTYDQTVRLCRLEDEDEASAAMRTREEWAEDIAQTPSRNLNDIAKKARILLTRTVETDALTNGCSGDINDVALIISIQRDLARMLEVSAEGTATGIVTELAQKIKRLWEVYHETEDRFQDVEPDSIDHYKRNRTHENLSLLSRALQFQLLIAAPVSISEAAIQIAMAQDALRLRAVQADEDPVLKSSEIEVPESVAYNALNRAALFLARTQGMDLVNLIGTTNYVSEQDCDTPAIAEVLTHKPPAPKTAAKPKRKRASKPKPVILKKAA